jgi:hypothetical protein
MQNQNLFMLPPNAGQQGLLQISTPSQEESAAAATALSLASEHAQSALALPALA